MLPRNRAIAAVVLAGCATASHSAEDQLEIPYSNPAVFETVSVTRYAVSGASIQQIRKSMADAALVVDGKKFLGEYLSRITYNYTTSAIGSSCSAKSHIDLDSKTFIPIWSDSATADTTLQSQWGLYIKNLGGHERNHRQIARKYSDQIQKKINSLSASSCPLLDTDIKRAFNDLWRLEEREQQLYDQTTSHGATEGASFPPRRQLSGPGRS